MIDHAGVGTPICAVRDPGGGAAADVARMAVHAKALGFAALELLDLGEVAFAAPRAAAGRASGLLRDGDMAVVADARIDDRIRLAAALGTPSDRPATELILAAWRRWGRECPVELLGDYAFAVWDAGAGTLFAARDPVGARPLLFACDRGRLIAASDIGLVMAAGVDAVPDEREITAKLVNYTYISARRTFLAGIDRLPAAHWLVHAPGAGSDGAELGRYWYPDRVPAIRHGNREAYLQQLRDLMTVAVEDRLDPTRPMGVHVTGGLDSTVVAMLAKSMLRTAGAPDPVGFTWNAPPTPDDVDGEQERLAAAHKALGIELCRSVPTVDDVKMFFCADVLHSLEYSSLIPEARVQETASARGIGVILSGWGGDQGVSFNGRGYLLSLLLRGRWLAFARQAKSAGISPVRLARRVLGRHIGSSMPPIPHFAADRLIARYPPKPVPKVDLASARANQCAMLDDGVVSARMECWAISGAKRGLTYHYPLTDRRLLDFALGVPEALFVQGSTNRWLMRAAIDPWLPSEVVWNPIKQERDRINFVHAVIRHACADIAQALDGTAPQPRGSERIDMRRLTAELNEISLGKAFMPGPVRTALQLLER